MYEPTKGRATAVYIWVPSKYKIEPATVSILGKCASIRDRCDAMKCTCIWHACIINSTYRIPYSWKIWRGIKYGGLAV